MEQLLNQLQRRMKDSRHLKPGSLFFRSLLSALLAFVLIIGLLPATLSVGAQTTNLALNRPVTCSSIEFPCAEAVDGNAGTRWSSVAGVDPQWIYVDLGATYNITRVVLTWETAYASGYQIQVAAAAAGPWTNIFSTTTGNGATDDLTGLSGSGRYVRMNGTVRATGWGYSLWEYAVYGTTGTGPTATRTNTPATVATATRTATRTNTPVGPTATRTRTPTVTNTSVPAGCGTTNTALNKTATSSSNENAAMTPNFAVDGNGGTRWSSLAGVDPQWIQVDLGATYNICRVVLTWEAAYASGYQIQTSASATGPWTNIFSTTTGNGATDDLTGLSGSGRYIRMNGTARGSAWGYSLWEFEVYTGSGGPTATRTNTPVGPTLTPTRTNTPGGSAVSVQVVVPIVEYVQIGLSPADLNGQSTVITQNTSQTATLSYTNGTSITFAINSMTSATGQTAIFSAVDSGGVTRTGAPLTITAFQGLVVNLVLVNPTPTPIAATNLALNRPATASTSQAGLTPNLAVDGNTGTRWSSEPADPQWIQIDLGSTQTIARVILTWEAAYATGYQIQTSNSATGPWTNIYTTTTGNGATDDLIGLSGSGRYIRMNGTARGSVYGYSLWEFAVYATGPAPTPTTAPTFTPTATAPAAFGLLAPANNAMITNTRRPALSWNAYPGTVRYEVWVNISRTDYDFTASGNLLDRYTKLADVTGTSYTPTIDLSDRWTYKWYVNSVDGGNVVRKSNTFTFGVYLPVIETIADGVNIVNGSRDMNKNGAIEPYEDWRLPIETRVNDLLSRMTATEKAYQMFYNAQVYPLAGWAMGPMSPQDLYNKQLAAAGTRLGIPMVSPGDTIHGYITSFPVQTALAAGRDYLTIYQLGDMQRREELAVGARGVLGPLAEVDTKVLYPRFQEGNGENADIAAAVVRALVSGLQGGPELNPQSVLVTTKHWPGEGAGGEAGITYDAVSIKYHMIPWRAAFEAGSGGVMPGYAGSSYLDPGGPGAGDSKPIIDYLRINMAYDGLVTTDWLPSGSWINAAKAGSDVMGGADPGAVGFDMNNFIANVPASRIDEAVRRILRVKFRLGVFETPYGDPANGPNVFHTPANMALVTKAAKGAMTLLKNTGVLPLRLNAGDYLLVTGARATDGPSCCIWTSYFHPEYGSLTMWQAIQQRAQQAGVTACLDSCPGTPRAAIVITGEPSYTHGTSWPKEQPYLTADQLTLIQNLKAQGLPVVVVYTMPRPYIINWEAANANAIVVAYRSGEGGGPALAQLLFGDYSPTGKLPFQLPRDMNQIGTDVESNQLERWDLPYDLGATAAERTDIRNRINAGQTVPTTYGNPLYPFGAGLQGFGLTDGTVPTAFNLTAPANGATVSNNLPTLTWQASSDPETGIQHYQVFVDNVRVATVTTTSYTLTQQLTSGTHNWYVIATNWANGTRTSSTFSFNFQDTQVPNAFNLASPASGATLSGSSQTLVWESSYDSGSGLARYEVWLDGANVSNITSAGSLPNTGNLALGKPVIASSTQAGPNSPALATDGNATTRWESQFSDPQWIYVDLGQLTVVKRVVLSWEAAYGTAYQIQVSNSPSGPWTNIYTTTTGNGGIDDLTGLMGAGRYVRMNGTARATGYGYSLFEFEVYGTPAESYTRTGLSAGSHSWYVVAVDAFGNRRQSTSTFNFTIQ